MTQQNKWQLHRAGLLNYWYYDDQEYYFAGGRLLLRGDNGSGKSVTMQSFIPLLLDGKKSPDRLDPFGSRARKIEDYLLGEKGPNTPEERTGYLYIEFKLGELERYLTIGTGLKVKRGQTPDSWGFSITDNRRLGYDLQLYKTEYDGSSGKEEKIPLSYRELENLLSTGGQVVKGQEEYMKMVNQLLFGFENLEKYDELIKLLIHLRSPKLSKDFKPTVIHEILNNALPSLSDDELRTLSETLENMDTLREEVEHQENQFEAVKRLEKVYTQYNRYLIYEKAYGFLREMKKYGEERDEFDRLGQTIENSKVDLEAEAVTLAELQNRLKSAEQTKEDLEQHDAIGAAREKARLQQEISDNESKMREKNKRLEEKETTERQLKYQIEQDQTSAREHFLSIEECLEMMDDLAEDAYYDGHQEVRAEYLAEPQTFASFDLWKDEVASYRKRLEQLLEKAQEVSRADQIQRDLQREVGEILARVEATGYQMDKSEKLLDSAREEFVNNVFAWQKGNRLLTNLTAEMQEIARLAPEYPVVRFDRLLEPVRLRYDAEKTAIGQKKLQFAHEARLQEQELARIQQELEEWRNKRDPEPERHPETVKSRELLRERQIPHIPFFAAVEFREQVAEDIRAQLEGALKEAGLLDSLILSRTAEEKGLPFHDGLADAYLKRNPQILRPTLYDYLEPAVSGECGVASSDVDEILRSILIYDEVGGETFIASDGTYGIGLKVGKAPKLEKATFIGREARRQYRQMMIEQLLSERERVEGLLSQLRQGLAACEDALLTLKQELDAFPPETAMREAFEQYDRIGREYKDLRRQQAEKDRKWKEVLEAFQLCKRELQAMLAGEKLPAAEESIKDSLSAMKHYEKTLWDLNLEHTQYRNMLDRVQSNSTKLDDLYNDLDDLRVEIRDLRQLLKNHQERVQALEQLMKELGIEEINRQMNECLQIIQQYPAKILTCGQAVATLQNEIKNMQEKYFAQKTGIEHRQHQLQEWEAVFMDEAALLYYFRTKEELQAKPSQLARQVHRDAQDWVKNQQLTRQKVTDRLNQAYYQELTILQDYHLNLQDIFAPQYTGSELEQNQARQQASRVELTILRQGKVISLYTFQRELEEELTLKQNLMNEEDRHLYEDIILKGLGKTIQTKIQRADLWVKEMNRLMEERDTSSGLTFSLQWVPRGTKNEQEMSADDLVDLLKRDPRFLKPEDLERLVNHFRSRIQEARANMEENGYNESLHQAIRDVLDYRQWFRFVLYYQKEGNRKKELTNHVFDTFSGGEKAMAMYIPLFSAVYSHYTQARDDAPRMISLDEAFAGVDENNIRDMFALVEQLGFNFIMNSQILWGDYDTIPELAIAELIRPKNARCVSVIHYYWNGKIRELLAPGTRGMEALASGEVAFVAED